MGIAIKVLFGFKNIKNVLCLMKLREIKKELAEKEFLTLHLKNTDFQTSGSETSENVFIFVFLTVCFLWNMWIPAIFL